MNKLLKQYLNYCNKSLYDGASTKSIFLKGIARSIPLGSFVILFLLGHVYGNNLSLIALGFGTLFMVYLLGLV